MSLNFKSFSQIIADQVAAIQSASKALVDFAIGSILRSMAEGNAGVVLWLQGLILRLLATTRAATSSGADLDSWFADYGFTRQQAKAASGPVTFSRATPTMQAVVLVGANVEIADASITFTVTVDTTNPNYNAGFNGYVLAPDTASIDVPVQAVQAGVQGNVAANTINTIATPIIGVDSVNNSAPFTNGADKEDDTSARASFVLYLAALAKANKAAIQFAILKTQGVASYSLTENKDSLGNDKLGYFYAVIDNGSNGTIPSDLIDSTRDNVDAVRGLTIRFEIFGRTIVTANVVAQIIVDSHYNSALLISGAITALQNYINTLPVGIPLRYTRIAQVIYNSSPGITDVTAVTLNGSTSDLTVTNLQAVKAGTVSVGLVP